jgi:hypothetical protein
MNRLSHLYIPIGCLVLFALCEAPVLYAQKNSTLDSFFVAAHVVSDAAPFWFEYILDVQPEGSGSRVRNVRMAPASSFCSNVVTVRGIEKRIELPPSSLSGEAKLCSMDTEEFNRSIARFTANASIFDTVGFTVVASCGQTRKIFNVPYVETLNLDGLRKESPAVARVIDLSSNVEKSVFPNEPINGENHPKDYELQVAGQSLVSDLKSGRFDAAFGKGRLQEILRLYHGPVRTTAPQPVLIDERWDFVKFVPPVYPPLGRLARIQSKVQLELTVDPATGRVVDTRVQAGHPILNDSTVDAARQWVFSTSQTLPEKITLTLNYSLACQLVQ